ncbi:MAG: hypothetical protein Q9227_001745 [Pyrenula ochraceoflavens]
MAAAFHAPPPHSKMVQQKMPFGAPNAAPAPTAPAGTFIPGTKVQVGNHRVVIEKYLSEGGFAHVYVVRLPRPVDGSEIAVLKRVAVPDKDHLANMRTEVETMKRLRGHRHIVTYMDSHASQLKGGGYEVFLLMEFCQGGGLIDFMNTRLQNRLTEPEILHIFSDVAEGVACMHYLKPPLLHRDLKVENVLISTLRSSKTYKLCDFGSAAPPRPPATTAAEGRLIEDDIQRHTTLQYRSPEMIDVYRKQPIDEKSDVWALGVLLYKLCYYTTPFEEVGQMAILNASFKYPPYPVFSDGMKLLIWKEVPIKDIYTGRTESEARRNHKLPPSPQDSAPNVGAHLQPLPKQEKHAIPEIAPMRRGRPTKPVSHHASAHPSPSPLRMIDSDDPFSSLDGGKGQSGDELSTRFPTLDQFSLLHETGKKFEFEPGSTTSTKKEPESRELSQRVTNALADQAFMKSPSPARESFRAREAPPPASVPTIEKRRSPERHQISSKPPSIAQSVPPKPKMVSTGTMTSPPSPPIGTTSNRTSHHFTPSEARTSSQPFASNRDRIRVEPDLPPSKRSNLFIPDLKSKSTTEVGPTSPASSRPSLETSRPSALDLGLVDDNALSRSRSANVRQRPLSVTLESRRDYSRPLLDERHRQSSYTRGDDNAIHPGESETNISSDVDFLRAKEEEEQERKREKRQSSGSTHKKRTSLPSISLSGTKNLLAGRFGDAFRKFEAGEKEPRSRSPSPSRNPLTLEPIEGSEATDGLSDEGNFAIDETEDVSPEVRRELERRRLSQEEKRVAEAAAEYRRRLAEKGGGGGGIGPNRAVTIQNKVQSLLKENDKPATKTATGYGRFTDLEEKPQIRQFETATANPSLPQSIDRQQPLPPTTTNGLRKAVPEAQGMRPSQSQSQSLPPQQQSPAPPPKPPRPNMTSSSAQDLPLPPPPSSTSSALSPRGAPSASTVRPTAPPKPKTLRTGQNDPVSQPPLGTLPRSTPQQQQQANSPATAAPGDDWEAQFAKKYPSLNRLEMVETEIGNANANANASSNTRSSLTSRGGGGGGK